MLKSPHAKDHSMSKEKLKRFLPKGSAHSVTDEILRVIACVEDNTGLEQLEFEKEVLSRINIVSELKCDVDDYVNALQYCILTNNISNAKAYELVFPERVAKQKAKKKLMEEREARGEKFVQVNIDSFVSNYNKNEIVVKLKAQMLVDVHIMYAPYFHAAVKKQFDLMNGRASPTPDGEFMVVTPTVQQKAGESLATLTKAPEESKVTLDMKIKDNSLDDLKDSLADAAEKQLDMLKSGKIDLTTLGGLKPKKAVEEEIIDV